MRTILFPLILYLSLLHCSAPIKQFYADSYFNEDNIYQNKPLHFMLSFEGSWDIVTDPNFMQRSIKKLAKEYHAQGTELLFIGSTTDALQGTQGIAVNLNASTREYAKIIRKMNKNNISIDSGLTDIIFHNKPMIRWDYFKFGFQFVEFFFTIDTYNIRISFWAKPDIFIRFLPIYLKNMASIELIGLY